MNSFTIYQRNNDLYRKITQHLPESKHLLNNKIRRKTRGESEQELLDFYHLVLKHTRACSLTSVCASHLHSKPLIARILEFVDASKMPTYPLIVCMVDLVKNDPDILTASVQKQFLQLACPLWQHESIYMRRKSMELCSRMIPYADTVVVFIDCLKKFIDQCQQTMTIDDLERLRSEEYTEFFHNNDSTKSFDRETIKLAVQMMLKILLNPNIKSQPFYMLGKRITDIYKRHPEIDFKGILFDICCANDDDTVFLLDAVLSIRKLRKHFPIDFLSALGMNEHYVFFYFLYRCGNTHDIIIDLLLGNESNFLDYLIRYTAHARSFYFLVLLLKLEEHIPTNVDIVLDILAKTILVLEGVGLPYNTEPLVKRLIALEDYIIDFYENHTKPVEADSV